jgi:PAS domain S-box-containing protein
MLRQLKRTNIINILLLLALLGVLGADTITYMQRQQSLVTNSWVTHTYKVLDAASKSQLYVTEIQAKMSDYLITNDLKFVTDIPRLENVANAYINLVQYLTRDNPNQQQRCLQLKDLIKQKFDLITQITNEYSTDTNKNATAQKLTLQRTAVMANISEVFRDVSHTEVELLNIREKNFERQTIDSNSLFITASILSSILLLLTFIVLNYQSHRRLISERKRIESEKYNSAILESASDSIITINVEGEVLSCNSTTKKIFDYDPKQMLSKNICLLMPDLLKDLEKLSGSGVHDFNALRKDGKPFPAEVTISKMLLDDKDIFIIIIRDVTERKKIEILKNEFVSVVSHELRTPLTSIRGSLGLLISGTMGAFPEKAKKMLDIANHNCDRLLRLINDILDIEKIEAGKIELKYRVIDLNEIVEEAIDSHKMYSDMYQVSMALVSTVPDIKVNVDPGRLMQVLANLISNAAKFSTKDGEIKISISEKNGIARVSVRDSGKGIPKEFQNRIFQKFSQADTTDSRAKGGTGLGLSISKMIAEKLGGKLGFTSQENVGSTFYFDLPVFDESQLEVQHKKSPVTISALHKGRLLLCEDDEDQAKYLQVLLESAKYETDIAGTVAEAKTFLLENEYQALLLDLILPDQDGISFIRELRNSDATRELPIIVLSIIAKTGQSILEGNAFSVLDWIEKPIDFNKLLNVINHIKGKLNVHIPHILHIEDDLDIQAVIASLFQDSATVTSVTTVKLAKEQLAKEQYDIVILDLLLPDGNGIELIPAISKQGVPIVVFSSEELSQEHSRKVQHNFVKSKTSNEQLLEIIRKLIQPD